MTIRQGPHTFTFVAHGKVAKNLYDAWKARPRLPVPYTPATLVIILGASVTSEDADNKLVLRGDVMTQLRFNSTMRTAIAVAQGELC